MSYMCVLSTSLYGGKECDDCGKCEHRYDEPEYDEDEYFYEEDEDEQSFASNTAGV